MVRRGLLKKSPGQEDRRTGDLWIDVDGSGDWRRLIRLAEERDLSLARPWQSLSEAQRHVETLFGAFPVVGDLFDVVQGLRNKEIARLLDLAPAIVSTV